jgi:aromatic ring-cleaving dioxygenase
MPASSAPPRSWTPSGIREYHAHIYYDPHTRDRAARLRERVAAAFPAAILGRWHDAPVGPHPQSMYQIAFPREMLAAFLPWLMLNRDGLTILLHPETGDDYTGPLRPRRMVRRRAAAKAGDFPLVILVGWVELFAKPIAWACNWNSAAAA